VSVRLAYLCNRYPAVSHSFVRREIEAVEAAGHSVHRFSLRPAADLNDEVDFQEAARTQAALTQGAVRLLLAALAQFGSRPIKSLSALRTAWRLSGPGLDQKVRHLAYFLEAAWLARRLEELKVEHLHAHFGTNPAAVALISRAFGGPTYSFTVHGPDEFDAPIGLSLREKIEGAKFVVAISSYGRSQLMRWISPEGWPKIRVIRSGLDKQFLDAPVQPVPANSTKFVCVARLAPQKGLPLLIAACEQLRSNGEDFSLTVIGSGDMRPELEKDVDQRGLKAIVTFVGVSSWPELWNHLLSARAFVLPSFAEGLPMVIMEALALSRPVVTTAIAGIPELVDAECGWVIPAGSEEALVDAMTEALRASPEELARKGAVGRKRVGHLHDGERNAALILAAISEGASDALTCTR
jgi:colanic acid/amylovoran biosynthesis glycosyltransferase